MSVVGFVCFCLTVSVDVGEIYQKHCGTSENIIGIKEAMVMW